MTEATVGAAMSGDARCFIAIAGEDHAHRVLATRLSDLVLIERGAACGWPEQEELDQARVYVGLDRRATEPRQFYCTTDLADGIQTLRQPFRLHRIDDQPAGEAEWFVTLYAWFLAQPDLPDALVAMSDAQNNANAQEAADRAARYIRDNFQRPIPVVFGVPHWDAECWFVAGLQQIAPDRLSAAAQALSFDPARQPHRLTAQPNDAIRDAKRALRFLIGAGGATLASTKTGALACEEYEALAGEWDVADLARLQAHEGCGLSAFIRALRAVIAPAVVPGPQP